MNVSISPFWLCVFGVMLQAIARPALAQNKGKSEFVLRLVPKGQEVSTIPKKFLPLVYDQRGFVDIKSHPVDDKELRNIVRTPVLIDGQEKAVIRLRILDHEVGKGIPLSTFLNSMDKFRTFRNPELPTYVYIVVGE